jgi:cellulose synthase/poly-beta-1,6-N-acetylglucosamine synthase-like glycosyltransferase
MSLLLCVAYFAVLLVLSSYGLHRMHLVVLCWRHRQRIQAITEPGEPLPDDQLPMVTLQLPIFNESTVVERLLETVSEMDYPKDRLELQVLDDSTDETRHIAAAKVRELRERGFDASYIHRVDRVGYKAGALDNGLEQAKGDLIGIFDADFLPRPDFARALVEHFSDPEVGMVQARWAHLNRDASLLTKVQALMLDGHHMVENRARYGAKLFFNFSGTGGMWRRQAIADAGGWQHDTLTEDLDLSYRAQLAGWRFVYRPDVVSPAELPEDISALRAQQYRWAKGTVQTARKLWRTLLRSELSFSQRVEALFHLTPHFAYPLMLALCVLLLPVLSSIHVNNWQTALMFDLPLCMAPISSLAAFYMLAETSQGRSRWQALRVLPALISLGAGLAPHLTAAVFDGLRNSSGEFVRTPKRGTDRWRYRAQMDLPLVEILFTLICGASVVMSIRTGHYFATPFAALFTFGFGYVAYLVAAEAFGRRGREVSDAPPLEAMPASGTRAKGKAAALRDVAA